MTDKSTTKKLSDDEITDYINSLEEYKIKIGVEAEFLENGDIVLKPSKMNEELKKIYDIAEMNGLVSIVAKKTRKNLKKNFYKQDSRIFDDRMISASIEIKRIKFVFQCLFFHDRERDFYAYSCYSPSETDDYFIVKAVGLACDRAIAAMKAFDNGKPGKIYKVKGVITTHGLNLIEARHAF